MTSQAVKDQHPGADAEKPQEIPGRGWMQILKRSAKETSADQMPLIAAGVAFYSFLSLFPALIAAVMIYGLAADRQTVLEQSEDLTQALPDDAASLITDQLKAIIATPEQSLGLGLLVALALALYSASGGVGNMVTAVNLAYDEEETRGFVKRKLLSLGLTVGAIIFIVIAVGLIAVVPVLLETVVPSGAGYWLAQIGRWVLLLVAISLALSVLYRLAPDRDDPQFKWVSVGAVVATVLWLVASVGFSVYVSNFGSYGKTYGALAGVVVLLLWLWITNLVVLLGAEINAEAEQQTAADTTTGEPRPLGQRDAVKADTVPEDPDAGEGSDEATDRTQSAASRR